MTYQLNQQQQQTLNLMMNGHNLFLTGYAGTGKSAIINAFKNQCTRETIFLAPSGMAASNIKGMTIHRFFSLLPMDEFPACHTPELPMESVVMLSKAETIVIDEISMVRSDLFTMVERLLRKYPLHGKSGRTFGGRQIILVGDFCQLPPVIKTATVYQNLVATQGGIYAFQTRAWAEHGFETVFLRDIFRQRQDSIFAEILNHIRVGTVDLSFPHESCWGELLHGTSLDALNSVPEIITQPPANRPVLCMTSNQAEGINYKRELDNCNHVKEYRAYVGGRFEVDNYPTEFILRLKPGSRVMLTANLGMGGNGLEYVNGDIGIVKNVSPECVHVAFDKGGLHMISYFKWSAYEYAIKRNPISDENELVAVEIGEFIQMPLKLAHALTVHKCQGITLPEAHIDMGRGIFASGQLYVALSRCASLRGLSLSRKLLTEDLLVDPAVLNFDMVCQMSSIC